MFEDKKEQVLVTKAWSDELFKMADDCEDKVSKFIMSSESVTDIIENSKKLAIAASALVGFCKSVKYITND